MIVLALLVALAQPQEAVPRPGPTMPKGPSQAAVQNPPLGLGDYVCRSAGAPSTALPALSFRIVDEQRYASLSGQVQGTYRIEGARVLFKGGHLDGEIGRDLANSTFKLAGLEPCARGHL